jgi:hypothetical protein
VTAEARPATYGHNVGRFKADHKAWRVEIGFEGFGYCARRLNENGHPRGKATQARTLDELHGLLAAAEAAT